MAKQGMKCLAKIYDPFMDTWWGLFQIKDEFGLPIQFRLPINEEDFEVGKSYRLKVQEYIGPPDG